MTTDHSPDERFTLWTRNVIDKFKPLSTEEIRTELRKTQAPASVMMSMVEHDFNFGNVVRISNNFNIECVYYYGQKRYDKRANVGTHNYTDVIHLPSVDAIRELKNRYQFVALENNVPNTASLLDFQWPLDPVLIVVGSESRGLVEDKDVFALCDCVVEIPSFGSVRSLNVSNAVAIALYDYRHQTKKREKK